MAIRLTQQQLRALIEANVLDIRPRLFKKKIQSMQQRFAQYGEDEREAWKALKALLQRLPTRNKRFMFPTILSDYDRDADPVVAIVLELPDDVAIFGRNPAHVDDMTIQERFALELIEKMGDELVAALESNIRLLKEFEKEWNERQPSTELDAVKRSRSTIRYSFTRDIAMIRKVQKAITSTRKGD